MVGALTFAARVPYPAIPVAQSAGLVYRLKRQESRPVSALGLPDKRNHNPAFSMMTKALQKIRVECCDLTIGMFVCELDRPWLESPFMLQGFYLKDIEDIDTVRDVCDYVYIDKVVNIHQITNNLPTASMAMLMNSQIINPGASGTGSGASRARVSMSNLAEQGSRSRTQYKGQSIEAFFPERKLVEYKDTVNWREETRNAKRAISYLYDYIVQFMNLCAKRDRFDLQYTSKALAPMVESVIRNPDACLWWISMRPDKDHCHDSALRTSVYSAVLGRRLGLPEADLFLLATGGLLFDIGKLRLDEKILGADRRLTQQELVHVQSHVEIGLELLKNNGLDISPIIEYVAHHHERFDGSGYPERLHADNIPPFARIAGLVDCYNAMTSNRGYASIRSPAEAINQLYKLKDVHFHTDLIEEFIQAIGVYPVGALVELSSGEVAIVVAQSRSRRLRPVLLLLLDADKKPIANPGYVELETATHMDDGGKLDIVKNLEPNAYDIDMDAIRLV